MSDRHSRHGARRYDLQLLIGSEQHHPRSLDLGLRHESLHNEDICSTSPAVVVAGQPTATRLGYGVT